MLKPGHMLRLTPLAFAALRVVMQTPIGKVRALVVHLHPPVTEDGDARVVSSSRSDHFPVIAEFVRAPPFTIRPAAPSGGSLVNPRPVVNSPSPRGRTPQGRSTSTGVRRPMVVPSPRAPDALLPQHQATPAGVTAQAKAEPLLIEVTDDSEATFTSDSRVVVEPSPTWPAKFSPQHRGWPPAMTMQPPP